MILFRRNTQLREKETPLLNYLHTSENPRSELLLFLTSDTNGKSNGEYVAQTCMNQTVNLNNRRQSIKITSYAM